MRAVLYAEDFEPITVIELTPFAADHLQQRGMVRLAVQTPVQVSSTHTALSDFSFRTVTIHAELLRRGKHTHLMLFTQDEESALLLKSAFLPGQHKDVQGREKQAFAQGFISALSRLS